MELVGKFLKYSGLNPTINFSLGNLVGNKSDLTETKLDPSYTQKILKDDYNSR